MLALLSAFDSTATETSGSITATDTHIAAMMPTRTPLTSTNTSTSMPISPSPLDGRGGGLIAFSSDQDGDFEIWVMNADGSNQHKLTDNTAMDISPSWSPDGNRIAFVSNWDGNDEIYVMNADASDVHRLTETAVASESFPAWSPDGTEISFDIGAIANGVLLSRVDEDGNILWRQSLLDPQAVYGGMALAELEDGGYLVAGLIQIVGGRSYDAFLLRTEADGRLGE